MLEQGGKSIDDDMGLVVFCGKQAISRLANDSAPIAASAAAMLSGCAGTTDGSGFLLFI
jgi:hypothetical protein